MSVGERARLFVALELPAEIRAALASWRPRVAGWRLLPDEALHVTLCFLGWVDAAAVDPIAAACGVVSDRAPVRLALSEPVWLPRRRPRVLAVSLTDTSGELAAVQAALALALAAGG